MENEEQDFQEEANEEIISDNDENNESRNYDSSPEGDEEEIETYTFTREELEERDKDIRKKQDKRWKEERLKKADKSKKESHSQEKSDKKEEVSSDERYNRLELKTEGVKEKEQQDLVLDYAQLKGVSVTEALNSPIVKAELKEMEVVASNRQATSNPSRRTAQTKKDDTSYLIAQFEKGKLPDTPEARTKLRKALAGR